MLKLGAIIIVQLASLASILGLYFTLLPPGADRPFWHWVPIIFAVAVFLQLAFREVSDHLRSAPKVYRSKEKINSYMRDWVSSAGRVVIFSRDMSWAGETEVRQLLLDKAKRNELTVYLERRIPLTDELEQQGAKIVTYEELGHVPRSRFTIVDFGREGARVAVGVKVGDDHVIQQFRSGDHPFFAVAEDLVKFLLPLNHENLNVPKG